MNKELTARVHKQIDALELVRTGLDEIKADLQSDFDDLSEKSQEGAKGEAITAEIDALDNAYDSVESAVESCKEATDKD